MVRELASGETPRLIALSAGGSDKELSTHGVDVEQIERLMVQMTAGLLHHGRLAYGGTLGIPEQRLTALLVEAAQAWLREKRAEAADANQPDANRPDAWPLVNYAAWPNYHSITPAMRANLVGVCQFKDIDPPGVALQRLDELMKIENYRSDAEVQMLMAHALTAMRQLSAQESSLRIVWGGKIAGAAGWMPGILEEVVYSLREDKPILILGGFGGCAYLIAEYLMHIEAAWPKEFPTTASLSPEQLARMSPSEREQCQSNIDDAQKLLKRYRDQIHGRNSVHGIATELLVEALSCRSADRAIELALTVAKSSTP